MHLFVNTSEHNTENTSHFFPYELFLFTFDYLFLKQTDIVKEQACSSQLSIMRKVKVFTTALHIQKPDYFMEIFK